MVKPRRESVNLEGTGIPDSRRGRESVTFEGRELLAFEVEGTRDFRKGGNR